MEIKFKTSNTNKSIRKATRMGNEKHFDENGVMYDKYRPTYVAELYSDIINYTSITENSNILEIGCGTGNATLPFIKTGAKVTAVELGENLTDYTKDKFSEYDNFNIINARFEDYKTDEKYDLIFAATAFHWIKPEYAYSRCKDLLTPYGVLATFWNTPRISRHNAELYSEIQALYAEYLPDSKEESASLTESKWYTSRCNRLGGYIETYGYADCLFKLYQGKRKFNADDYIGLLHTYSDHMALCEEKRSVFFDKIHSAIQKHGQIDLIDTIDLHIGRKND